MPEKSGRHLTLQASWSHAVLVSFLSSYCGLKDGKAFDGQSFRSVMRRGGCFIDWVQQAHLGPKANGIRNRLHRVGVPSDEKAAKAEAW